MAEQDEQTPAGADQPSEEDLRAAYEAELNRITSSEMILQTAVSLLNIGGRRLGLATPPGAPSRSAPGGRDLEQVRDAIDGARALLPILERRMQPRELAPLRDAVAQLQVAYAREAGAPAAQAPQGAAAAAGATGPGASGQGASGQGASGQGAPVSGGDLAGTDGAAQDPSNGPEKSAMERDKSSQEDDAPRPGPAQASGRLWVPGR